MDRAKIAQYRDLAERGFISKVEVLECLGALESALFGGDADAADKPRITDGPHCWFYTVGGLGVPALFDRWFTRPATGGHIGLIGVVVLPNGVATLGHSEDISFAVENPWPLPKELHAEQTQSDPL